MENNMTIQSSLVAERLSWPEAPRWRDGALWFADCHHFQLKKVISGHEPEVIASVPGRPAGMGFHPDGRLLLASALDKKLWWVGEEGDLVQAADLSDHARGLLNDMVVDANGRAWVGDTGFNLAAGGRERPGRLLTWAPGQAVECAAENVRFPNGIAITPDGATLYLAETFASQVTAFDIQENGRLANRRPHAQLEGRPDGMCLDDEGALWVALLWNREFHRIGKDGQVIQRIELDTEMAVSCVLGGEDRKTLFYCTAELDDRDKSNIRRNGFIRSMRVSRAGTGIP
jgi:sugar lactone lactonase YvrE